MHQWWSTSSQWVGWLCNRHLEYRALHSSVRSFARTAHSFACSALLASLPRFSVLIHLIAHSLTPELMGKRFLSLEWTRRFHTIYDYSLCRNPPCPSQLLLLENKLQMHLLPPFRWPSTIQALGITIAIWRFPFKANRTYPASGHHEIKRKSTSPYWNVTSGHYCSFFVDRSTQ